jgi:septum formation protein
MTDSNAIDLVLASASPRRRELIQQAGWRAEIVAAQVDESPRTGETPKDYVVRLAREKAAAVASQLARRRAALTVPVVGADTTVVIDGEILGKPADKEDARRMLRKLSGHTHEVVTGICLIHGAHESSRVVCTRVWFDVLTNEDIDTYVSSGEPMDKAGAYAIQGRAAKFIPRIEGDYFNVIGLPLAALRELLAETAA